jgi:CRP-like cAMP-binding protein
MTVLELLRANPHFSSLPASDLDDLAAAFTVASYPAKHVIFEEGHRCDSLYLVLSGQVAATHKERKRTHLVRLLNAGALFGMMSLLLDRHRSATCTTTEPSEVAALSRTAATFLINRSAPVALAFQKALATQLARDLRVSDERLRGIMSRLPA